MASELRPTGQTVQAATLEKVAEAIRSGDLGGAKRTAIQGLANGLEHPLLLNLRALDHEDAGRYENALADLRRAHILAPRDFAILNACGLCLSRMDRLEEAVHCFERAVAIQSDFAPAWFNMGSAQERLGETAAAAKAYLRSVELHPHNAQGWGNLAHLAARRGDKDETRLYSDRALALQPGQSTAILALVAAEMDTPAAGERRVRDLLAQPGLNNSERGLALGLLGDALDALERPAEAFAAYLEGNSCFRAESALQFEAPDQATVPATMQWLNAWAESLTPKSWGAQRREGGGRGTELGHVFLIGFPRSGTTLAENVLARHPDVVSLEEKNTLGASVTEFLRDAKSAAHLASMSDRALQPYRDDYWTRVRSYGIEPSDKIFIDKHPFNTLKIPLIYALFPNSKIIFSIRDPRDVVFSCFRRRFSLNSSMYEFLDLARTAAFYDSAMHLAETFRKLQSIDRYQLVYENLVSDFPGQARAICEFVGVGWRPDLVDFAARARRGDVASASSAQIARGLYADGIGHWRRYREQMAPVLDKLRPWVQRWGYTDD
jgi:Tfp pilus assembly protein PilF